MSHNLAPNLNDSYGVYEKESTISSLDPKYVIRESVNPLSQAFDGKLVVHPSLNDFKVKNEDIPQTLEKLLDCDLKNKATAYIHVPFCHTHCLYCGFYNKPYRYEESEIYADSLIQELALWENAKIMHSGSIQALYFGGGTPTALEAKDLKRILLATKKYLPLANDCEITIEGRLSHFDKAKMEACLEGGANRFSLGTQSFNTVLRRSMGRLSSREELFQQLELLSSYNEAAIIVDLIYGFPRQTLDMWKDELQTVHELGLDGCDCYQLNVYKQTPLGKAIDTGKIPPAANNDLRSAMYALAVDYLDQAFYRRLSLSHWARNTRERNIYNLHVKGNADCLAYGPGGGGSINGHFYINSSDWQTWLDNIANKRKPATMVQRPHKNYALFKCIMEEMEQGRLNLPLLEQIFSLSLGNICKPLFKQWEQAGMLNIRSGSAILTIAGQFWQVNLTQLLLDYLKNILEPVHV